MMLIFSLIISENASAQFVPEPTHVYQFVNRASHQVLEIGGDNRFTPFHAVNEWPSWGGACQQWQFEDNGTGFYNIRNRLTRQYLEIGPLDGQTPDSYGGNGYGNFYNPTMLNGAFADQNFRYPQNQEQDWTIEPVPGTLSQVTGRPYFRVKNRKSGKVLVNVSSTAKYLAIGASFTASQNWTWQWSQGSGIWQQYDIVDVSAYQGVYQIVNARSGMVLSADIADNHVSQLPGWWLGSQEWSFSGYNSDGYLAITARSTNQALEIGGGGDLTQPGRPANVWNWWGGANQQWALLDVIDSHRLSIAEASDGRMCYIYNRLSGKVLEIGGSASDVLRYDRIANQWYPVGGLNQQWYVRYVSLNRGTGTTSTEPVAADAKKSKKTAAQTLVLYPNPARGELNVALDSRSDLANELVEVSVTDLQGTPMQVPYVAGRLDLTQLAAGIYIVRASDGVRSYHQKFAKE